jgi:ferredoxin
MDTAIFFYTGTGNSLWVARKLAQGLGDSEVISISTWLKTRKAFPAKRIGLIFPVHMWGLPSPVVRFAQALQDFHPDYFFAVAVDGGQVANALIQLKKLTSQNPKTLDCGFEMVMPSNYIPWGGPGSKEKLDSIFAAAQQKMEGVITALQKQAKGHFDQGPLWQRIVFTQLYKLSYPQVPRMDRSFWVDSKCNKCGICRRVCPAQNITLLEGTPTWSHHCEQCLACLQWCPQEAIQYGKKTARYPRYHHPEIQLKDVLKP